MEKRIQFRRGNYAKEHTGQFWSRFLAFGIDMQFVWIVSIPVYLILDELGISEEYRIFNSPNFKLGTVVSLSTFILYFTLLEQSKWRGTIGKLFLRLSVSDMNGKQLSLAKSLLRNLLKIPSTISLIGVLIIDVTKHKQALHDLLAQTQVKRK